MIWDQWKRRLAIFLSVCILLTSGVFPERMLVQAAELKGGISLSVKLEKLSDDEDSNLDIIRGEYLKGTVLIDNFATANNRWMKELNIHVDIDEEHFNLVPYGASDYVMEDSKASFIESASNSYSDGEVKWSAAVSYGAISDYTARYPIALFHFQLRAKPDLTQNIDTQILINQNTSSYQGESSKGSGRINTYKFSYDSEKIKTVSIHSVDLTGLTASYNKNPVAELRNTEINPLDITVQGQYQSVEVISGGAVEVPSETGIVHTVDSSLITVRRVDDGVVSTKATVEEKRAYNTFQIAYTEGGITKTTNLDIWGYDILEEIVILPFNKVWSVGDSVGPEEIQVKAKYQSGRSEDVNSFWIAPHVLDAGENIISVFYTEESGMNNEPVTVTAEAVVVVDSEPVPVSPRAISFKVSLDEIEDTVFATQDDVITGTVSVEDYVSDNRVAFIENLELYLSVENACFEFLDMEGEYTKNLITEKNHVTTQVLENVPPGKDVLSWEYRKNKGLHLKKNENELFRFQIKTKEVSADRFSGISLDVKNIEGRDAEGVSQEILYTTGSAIRVVVTVPDVEIIEEEPDENAFVLEVSDSGRLSEYEENKYSAEWTEIQGSSYQFQLKPVYGGKLYNKDFTYTTTDSKVASVSKTGLVTVKNSGNVTLTAVTKSKPKEKASIQLLLIDRTPRLEETEITVNKFKTERPKIHIYAAYDTGLDYDGKFYTKEKNGEYLEFKNLNYEKKYGENTEYWVNVAEDLKSQKYNLYIRVNGIYLPIRVNAKAEYPKIRVTPGKINLFSREEAKSEMIVKTDPGVKIIQAVFEQELNNWFTFDNNGYSLTYQFNEERFNLLKDNKIKNIKGTIGFWVEGYKEIVPVKVTMPFTITPPKLVITPSTGQINTYLEPGRKTITFEVYRKSGNELIPVNIKNAAFADTQKVGKLYAGKPVYESGKNQITLKIDNKDNFKKAVKTKINITGVDSSGSEWLQMVSFTMSVSFIDKKPTASLSTKSISFNKNIQGASAEAYLNFSANPGSIFYENVNSSEFKAVGKNIEGAPKLSVTRISDVQYRITASPDENTGKGTYKFQFTPRLSNQEELKTLTLSVKVTDDLPKVTIHPETIYLNLNQKTDAAEISLSLEGAYFKNTGENYEVTTKNASDIFGEKFRLTLEPSTTAGTYTLSYPFSYGAKYNNAEGVAKVKLVVTKAKAAVKETLVKGTGIDLILRDSTKASYLLTSINTSLAIKKVEIASPSAVGSFFEVEEVKEQDGYTVKQMNIKVREDAELKTGTYKLPLVFSIGNRYDSEEYISDVVEKAVAVKVTEGQLKLSVSSKLQKLQMAHEDSAAIFSFSVASPEKAGIETVTLLNEAKLPKGAFRVITDKERGIIKIQLSNPALVKAGKKYGFQFEVKARGANKGTKQTFSVLIQK